MAHFYTQTDNGVEPRHFVEMAKDKTRTRPSRTTDAKKAFKEKGEVWFPSVTGVLGILDKPALVNWKVDKHLDEAFCIDTDTNITLEQFKKQVKAQTREEMDKAPKAGTNIHQILEDYFNGVLDYNNVTLLEVEICQTVARKLEEFFDLSFSDITCEKYFINNDKGYAGCADLIVKCKDGTNWVIDYKSKQEAAKFKVGKMAFPDHFRQLAAYGRAIFQFDAYRAANIFICLETGEIDFHEHSQADLQHGWLDFLDCLNFHKRNNYKPVEG